jgi:hypothetical protein
MPEGPYGARQGWRGQRIGWEGGLNFRLLAHTFVFGVIGLVLVSVPEWPAPIFSSGNSKRSLRKGSETCVRAGDNNNETQLGLDVDTRC